MTIQLYAKDGHECIMFHDLVQADADAVQSNQFIVCHDYEIGRASCRERV